MKTTSEECGFSKRRLSLVDQRDQSNRQLLKMIQIRLPLVNRNVTFGLYYFSIALLICHVKKTFLTISTTHQNISLPSILHQKGKATVFFQMVVNKFFHVSLAKLVLFI